MANPFPRFDVVPVCPTDHSYYSGSSAAPVSSGLHKKITREWKLLGSHLPDSIHVRVYEDRITLLRAAIGGASGTPYHDGLFFFDVEFPANYPTSPPKVQYRSFGLRINPNLYSNGYVCLSLINTWSGKKGERWDPSRSTILQVLLSIQALVLNERPYFNEPLFGGLKGRKMWEAVANSYNESAFCLSCRTMLYVISKPPAEFEPLVARHFLERGRPVLLAARAYASGRARVGYYSSSSSTEAADDGRRHVRKAFRKDIVALYRCLVVSFQSRGADVEDLLELKAEEPAPKGNIGRGIKKAWSKFKRLFGIKRSI